MNAFWGRIMALINAFRGMILGAQKSGPVPNHPQGVPFSLLDGSIATEGDDNNLAPNVDSHKKTASRPRRRFFPHALEITAQREKKPQDRAKYFYQRDEATWPRLLDNRLRSMILRRKQMPSWHEFEESAVRLLGSPEMKEDSKNRLKIEIRKTYRNYQDLCIREAASEEIASKARDATTNIQNRKYVDGTF